MASRKQARPSSSADDPTTDYARAVVAGAIVAGPHVRDACARHLRDLEDGPARGLRWDPAAAARYFRFCAVVLRLNGGEFEGMPFVLDPSQQFIGGSIFGWKAEGGMRRFRVVFIEQGKGNGKSPLAASVGLYGLVADGEARAEVYAAATKRDQAMILFRDAVAMVDQSPELSQRLTRSGRNPVWNLAHLESGSFFRPISSDSAQSGPRPHMALLDEVHEHKTGLMVEMMRAGTKGRRQALILMITNSGSDKQSVCWSYHEYAAKVAAGMLVDDSFFGYVCALDPERRETGLDGVERLIPADDPFRDEACWLKANPLLGTSIPLKYLREQVNQAKGMPAKEAIVRRLNFCQWTDASNPWIGADVWMRARDVDFDETLLAGRRCYGGLDLSSTTDLTAFALLFEPTAADPHWRQRTWFFLPADALAEKERRDRVPYSAWRAAGFLETPPGAAVDKRFVMARVVDSMARYDVASIGYDRWRIEDFKALCADEGVELPLEPFGQGFKDMAPAVDEYERMLISGELRHDGNPVLTWNAASAVVDTDPAGNRKPTKQRATGRIDGIVAGVMAAGRALTRTDDSIYSGDLFVV
jgi:phage terminase large subunit-like protein